ncbi:unnamed protein product, partial [Allacma fusca]
TSAKSLSTLVHKNVQPRSSPNLDDTRHVQQFAFCIAPIAVTVYGGVNMENSVSAESATKAVDTRRDQIVEKIVQSQIPISSELGNCLMHSIEIREPDHSDVTGSHPKNFLLQRKTSRPVSSQVEEKLEELSFVKYFPRGRFGKTWTRPLKLSTFEYFQQRIMSATRRFSDVSYLFYALCEIEEEQIKQKINVCCNMSQEEETSEWKYNPKNVHLVLSSIRGTPSYWMTYQGSVLAMIKQLGG